MAQTLDDASTESDDSDVAFAGLDFDGVDFGRGGEEAGGDGADAGDAPAARGAVPPGGGGGGGEAEAAEDPPAPAPIGADGSAAGGQAAVTAVPAAAGGTKATTTTAARRLSSVTFASRAVRPSEAEKMLLEAERDRLLPFPSCTVPPSPRDAGTAAGDGALEEAGEMLRLLEGGRYADVLRSPFAAGVFGAGGDSGTARDGEQEGGASMTDRIRTRLLRSFEGGGSAIVR